MIFEENHNHPEEKEIGYSQLLSVIVRRCGWIIGTLVIVLLGSAYNSLQKEPNYSSSMKILVEPNYSQQAGGRGQNTEGSMLVQNNVPVEIDYATLIQILQGSELLERAISSLESQYPDMTVESLRSRLSILRATQTETAIARDESETNILRIDYNSDDPEKTQEVLQVLQSIYLDYNQEQQELRLQNALSFINQQLPVVEQDVFRAEQSLENFRESQGLIDPEQRATDLAGALAQIEQNRQQVQADFREAQARYDVLEGQLKSTPQGALVSSRLSESARYQSLLNSYQEIELAIAEQRSQFTDESSYMRRLRQQLENQKLLLSQEVERILGSESVSISDEQLFIEGQFGETDIAIVRELGQVQSAASGLIARDQRLAQAEQEIRVELSRYPGLIAQCTKLQPEIEIQRDTLQQLLRARQDISIDIARGVLNWQVVETAQLGRKTGPNLVADMLVGGIAGLFLGLVLAFAREYMDNRGKPSYVLSGISDDPQMGNSMHLPGLSNPPQAVNEFPDYKEKE